MPIQRLTWDYFTLAQFYVKLYEFDDTPLHNYNLNVIAVIHR